MIDVSSSSSLHLRIPLATSRIAIKFVKTHTCRNVDADALRLWNLTSIPVDCNFKESTGYLKLDSKKNKIVTYGKVVVVSSLPGILSSCSCQGRVRTPKVNTLLSPFILFCGDCTLVPTTLHDHFPFPPSVLLSFNLRNELDVNPPLAMLLQQVFKENLRGSPSTPGKPTGFAEVKKESSDLLWLYNRPPDREPRLPLTLLDPIFARFVDN